MRPTCGPPTVPPPPPTWPAAVTKLTTAPAAQARMAATETEVRLTLHTPVGNKMEGETDQRRETFKGRTEEARDWLRMQGCESARASGATWPGVAAW